MTSITFNCVKLRGNYILQLFITTAKTNTLVDFKAKKYSSVPGLLQNAAVPFSEFPCCGVYPYKAC